MGISFKSFLFGDVSVFASESLKNNFLGIKFLENQSKLMKSMYISSNILQKFLPEV